MDHKYRVTAAEVLTEETTPMPTVHHLKMIYVVILDKSNRMMM